MCTANLRKFKTHKEIKMNGDHKKYRHFRKLRLLQIQVLLNSVLPPEMFAN